jgi:hypothetical protein
MFQEIKASLQQLYLEDERPWLVGFSGGKDSIRQPTDWRRSFLMLSYPFLLNSGKSPFRSFARTRAWRFPPLPK